MTSNSLQDIKSYLMSGFAISMRQESRKEMTLVGLRTSIIELCRWSKAQWVAAVPDDLAICEFECRKSECSFDGWANYRQELGSRELIGTLHITLSSEQLCAPGHNGR